MHRIGSCCVAIVIAFGLAGCDSPKPPALKVVEREGAVQIRGEVWADNWFAFHLGAERLVEDSTPVTTERSFNAEVFQFAADYPLQLNFVLRDFKADDTGLEYIGTNRQQMGDGGFIGQFTDVATGEAVAVTDADWRCLVLHEAPLDRACEDHADPTPGVAPCTYKSASAPEGWMAADYDDAHWSKAVEHSTLSVRPKGGYDAIDWLPGAKLIWTADLETHNTVLCRLTVPAPS